MENEVGHEIADALGILLRRTTRAQLHQQLTEGMGEAVDELTYPVLSALARTGPRSAADLAPDSRRRSLRRHPPRLTPGGHAASSAAKPTPPTAAPSYSSSPKTATAQ